MRGELQKNYNYYKIIKNVDIFEELEKRGISYKKTSKNLMINCPYHGERHPSFGINVSDKMGIFQCLSCGEKGTFFHLLSYLDDAPFEDVIRKYSKNYLDLKEIIDLKNFLKKSLKKKKKIKNNIKYFNPKFLNKFKKPYGDFLEYLIIERRLTENIIKKFNILCCDGSGNGYGKIWKDRIIIPIFQKDKFVGCTARYIYRCNKDKKVRKIPGSDISKVCYGLENIKKGSPVVCVEGEIDMIYLQQNNIPCSRTGKFLSKEMISELMDYTDYIVLALDGDVPYYPDPKKPKDCIEYQKKYLSKFFKVDVVILPQNKDPNDLNKKEINEFFGKWKNKNFFKK